MSSAFVRAAFLLVCFFINHAYAQVPGARQISKKQMSNVTHDYAFKDSLFDGMTAYFTDKSAEFVLAGPKNSYGLPLPQEAGTSYFISLAKDKNLDLTALDILFIQQALKTWDVEKNKIGYTFEPNGLGIKILKEGTGDFPPAGKNVRVHYTGRLLTGQKFDSSVDRGQPFAFPLGAGRVIRGWDEGIAKLRIGSKALLYIPADLGYGARGAGGVIPPNATLIFEVEVLGVE